MIQPLVTGDRGRIAVIAFDDEVQILQDFTGDTREIREAFEAIQPRAIRSGKMLDAVWQSVQMLKTAPQNARRVLLILSESRDRGSATKLPRAIEITQRAGVTIYPATYSAYASPWTSKDATPMPGGPDYAGGVADLFRLAKTNAAEAFARATGGEHFSFETMVGLENAITRAGAELHSQYLLSFVPRESKNEGYHRIAVGITSHPGVVVRARPGYWPSR